MPPPYLTVGLTGREEGFKRGSKPNDVEEAGWHEALKSHQHGILMGKEGILGFQKAFFPRSSHSTEAASKGTFRPLPAPDICSRHRFRPQSNNSLMLTRAWAKAIVIKLLLHVASLISQSHSVRVCQFRFTAYWPWAVRRAGSMHSLLPKENWHLRETHGLVSLVMEQASVWLSSRAFCIRNPPTIMN